MRLLILVTLAWDLAKSQMDIPVRVQKGTHYELKNFQNFYEGSVPLIYEIRLPKFTQAPTKSKNSGPVMNSFYEILVNGSRILQQLLPSGDMEIEDTSSTRIRRKRGLDYIASF
jgi:hypothetical protein